MPDKDGFDFLLQKALERKEPSPGFEARVLRAVAEGSSAPARKRWWPQWMPAAAAAMLVLCIGLAYQRHEHEAEGRRAKDKLVSALRITGAKLQHAQARVANISEVERSNQ